MSIKKIPEITLITAGSKRKVPFHRLGRPAVLLFLWQETEPLGDVVRDAVRARYPEPSQVLVINLADMRGLPRVMHRLAEREFRKGYERTAAKLPAGARPEEHVIIVPDWKGEMAEAVGTGDTHKTPAVAVLNSEAEVVGLYHGEDLVTAAMELLEGAGVEDE